jgi:hypothetical protein
MLLRSAPVVAEDGTLQLAHLAAFDGAVENPSLLFESSELHDFPFKVAGGG